MTNTWALSALWERLTIHLRTSRPTPLKIGHVNENAVVSEIIERRIQICKNMH
jgi:hypothetical protein